MLKDLFNIVRQSIYGRKTYIAGGLIVIWGALGWCLGYLEAEKAIEVILSGLALLGLRAGVSKGIKTPPVA